MYIDHQSKSPSADLDPLNDISQGVGFSITCQTSTYDYGVDISNLQTKCDRGYEDCEEKDFFRSIPVFVIEYGDIHKPTLLEHNTYGKPVGIEIMTSFKTDSGCRWVAHKETCTLRQAIVNYAVVLKSDTISLRYPH
jgi:hypothetical protein